MDAIRFRVQLHARPAIGRTFYEGYIDVVAVDEEAAARAARNDTVRTNW